MIFILGFIVALVTFLALKLILGVIQVVATRRSAKFRVDIVLIGFLVGCAVVVSHYT